MVTKRTLTLFHKAAVQVPAYADFLHERGVVPGNVKTSSDFERIPITSKKNYLQQYPLPKLVWGGDLNNPLIFCATSGSTGVPYYFPRNERLSRQYSWLIEDFLKNNGDKSTLVILAFGMGVWIGGIITHRAFEIAVERNNFPVSILPTGYNKVEVIKALRQLSPQFERTIIVGYPPFVKEIIDEASREQINLTKFNTRLIFAAESFTETFRDYMSKKTGADPLLDTMNIYGTADLGAMAAETPLSILIRRMASKTPQIFQAIFGQIEKTPTLAQFNPSFIEFEEVEGELLLNGNSALPLIRYAIGDHGGVISFNKMKQIFKKNGLDLDEKITKAGIRATVKKRPFVYVYERSNFAVTLHGILIYPEFIKEGLLDPDLMPFLTGRFTMITKFDKNHNQFLEVNIELQNGIAANQRLKNLVRRNVKRKLTEKSSEFHEVSKTIDANKLLKFVFWPHSHPKYFSPGVKQKWSLQDK